MELIAFVGSSKGVGRTQGEGFGVSAKGGRSKSIAGSKPICK
jgi:hypothetical protein